MGMRLGAILVFLLAGAAAGQTLGPVILQNGVVPIDSSSTTIQPGEWISIYGASLAAQAASWNGDFPLSLGGTSVEIDGKPAYLWYVSPGQINLQAPDDTATGTVPVTVSTPAGRTTSLVTLAPFAPSFSLLDSEHVAGIIVRQNGAYDVIGPTGKSLGYTTVAAKAGDIVELFGFGFGPTNPSVPSGQVFSGAAATVSPVALFINNVKVTPLFAGLSGAGLYQINFVVPPNAGSGDVSLVAAVGGVRTQSGVAISLQPSGAASQVESLTLSAGSIAAETSITGIVVVSVPVAAGSVVVSLSSSDPSVTVPASVSIATGMAFAAFDVSAGIVTSSQPVTITASYAGTSAQATVTTMLPSALSFSTMTLVGGWQVSSSQKVPVEWMLLPDSGAATWTANGGNLLPTFLGCAIAGGPSTLSCGSVAPFPANLLVTSGGIFLNATSGLLTFTINPIGASAYNGAFSGTLSVSGSDSSGATHSYSGPLTGDYTLTP
jgi:uncharacterized protein (TIGR03437 family)